MAVTARFLGIVEEGEEELALVMVVLVEPLCLENGSDG